MTHSQIVLSADTTPGPAMGDDPLGEVVVSEPAGDSAPDQAMDELRHRHPRFLIWYGEATRRYWGMPLWAGAHPKLVEATDPDEFTTRAADVEATGGFAEVAG